MVLTHGHIDYTYMIDKDGMFYCELPNGTTVKAETFKQLRAEIVKQVKMKPVSIAAVLAENNWGEPVKLIPIVVYGRNARTRALLYRTRDGKTDHCSRHGGGQLLALDQSQMKAGQQLVKAMYAATAAWEKFKETHKLNLSKHGL